MTKTVIESIVVEQSLHETFRATIIGWPGNTWEHALVQSAKHKSEKMKLEQSAYDIRQAFAAPSSWPWS